MNLEFSLIPFGQLTAVIPALLPYLNKSEFWTHKRAHVDDIVAFLFSNQMQLWVAYEKDSNKVYGHVVTEVKQYPRVKMLVLQYIAAEDHTMKWVQDKVFATLENYAKDTHCAGIEALGRPGWEPHMKKHDYTVKTVCYEKYFSEVVT